MTNGLKNLLLGATGIALVLTAAAPSSAQTSAQTSPQTSAAPIVAAAVDVTPLQQGEAHSAVIVLDAVNPAQNRLVATAGLGAVGSYYGSQND